MAENASNHDTMSVRAMKSELISPLFFPRFTNRIAIYINSPLLPTFEGVASLLHLEK